MLTSIALSISSANRRMTFTSTVMTFFLKPEECRLLSLPPCFFTHDGDRDVDVEVDSDEDSDLNSVEESDESSDEDNS